VQLLARARALAPGNEHYALVLAQLYLRQEKFEEARKTAEPLTRANVDPGLRAAAQSVLAGIKNYEEQVTRYKAARAAAEKSNADNEKGDGGGTPRLRLREEVDAGSNAATRPPGKTDDEMAADALASALNDALRKPLDGETRVRGVLTRIECTAKGLVFVVKVGDRLLRLSSAGFSDLHIIAYTPDAGSELSCGPRKREAPAVVTYRVAADARTKTDGSLVALEFVPAGFQLKQ
jgi:hypothetical protein